MKNINSFEKRSGKYGEGSKGPFQNDINARIGITIGGFATRSPLKLEQLRVKLNAEFSYYFGKGTLSRTPSDAFRRVLLVDRLVNRIDEIRSGKPKPYTPIWN
jgi:hypothetical protein